MNSGTWAAVMAGLFGLLGCGDDTSANTNGQGGSSNSGGASGAAGSAGAPELGGAAGSPQTAGSAGLAQTTGAAGSVGSDGSAGSAGAPELGGAAGSPQTAGAAGSVGSSGSTGLGGNESAAGGNGGAQAGAAGAGGSQDDRVLPLADGRTWTFRRTVLDPDKPHNCDRTIAEVRGTAQTQDGKTALQYYPACFSAAVLMVGGTGDEWTVYQGGTSRTYFGIPVEEGVRWSSGTANYRWHAEGAVDVPAGHFDNCWRRIYENDEANYIIFCRGVGIAIINVTESNYRLELESKNF